MREERMKENNFVFEDTNEGVVKLAAWIEDNELVKKYSGLEVGKNIMEEELKHPFL